MNSVSIVKLGPSWQSEAGTLALASLSLVCSCPGQMELMWPWSKGRLGVVGSWGMGCKDEAGHWTSLEASTGHGRQIPSRLPFSVANQFAMACGCLSTGPGTLNCM